MELRVCICVAHISDLVTKCCCNMHGFAQHSIDNDHQTTPIFTRLSKCLREPGHAMHDESSSDVMVCSSSSDAEVKHGSDVQPELHDNARDARQAHTRSRTARSDAYRFEVMLCKDKFGLGIYFTEAHGCAIVDLELPFYRLPDDGVAPGEASGVIAPGDELCAIDGRSLLGLPFTAVVEALRCVPMGDVTLAFERPMPRLVVVKSDSQCELTSDKSASQEPLLDNDSENNQREHEREESEQRSKRWGIFERLSSTAASIASSNSTSSSSSASTAAAMEIAALQAAVHELEAKLQAADAALEREQKCRFLAEKKNILYRNELVRATEENTALRFQLARQANSHAQYTQFCHDHVHVAI